MKISNDMLYGMCPCGSGKKFKFCCWAKCRDKIDEFMTESEIVQTVRCTASGIYDAKVDEKADEICREGVSCLKVGRIDEAKKYFAEACTISSGMWIAWNNRATCCWEEGDVEGAYETQKKGLELSSFRNTFAYAALSIYSYFLGRREESLQWLDRALEDKSPLSRDVAFCVCKALAFHNRHRDIVDYATSCGFATDELVAFFKGTAHANLKEENEAEKAWNDALDGLFGEDAEYYLDCLFDDMLPISLDGDWPYFTPRSFPFAELLRKDIEAGRDPFDRYPEAVIAAIKAIIAEDEVGDVATPQKILKVIEGQSGAEYETLRQQLEELINEQGGFSSEDILEDIVVEENSGLFVQGKPKWKYKYELNDDGESSEGCADFILDRLYFPYAEKYSSLGDFENGDFEIVLLEMVASSGTVPKDVPHVTAGMYSQLRTMLHDSIASFFDYYNKSYCICEMRWDNMYGGAILTIEEDGGTLNTFMVSKPDHFTRK
jgi:tetratricopeptide (TPR) repeat protein